MMQKRIEELFCEAKECIGLRRAKYRKALHVQEQVLLTKTTQNIKRMMSLLSRRGLKREAWGMSMDKNGIFECMDFFVQWISYLWGSKN